MNQGLQNGTCVFYLCAFILLLLLQINVGVCDQFIYTDTNAEDIVDENLSQTPLPTIYCSIRTSNTYLAGSLDNIKLTFKGSFSVSGPHSVGPFQTGQKAEVAVTLDRVIGDLQSVLLYKTGTDSYLLSQMRCRIKNQIFEMKGPRQWLDSLDPTSEAAYPASKGFEPLAQESSVTLPASPTLVLEVANVQYFYTSTGLA
jgi:hypothetical protein